MKIMIIMQICLLLYYVLIKYLLKKIEILIKRTSKYWYFSIKSNIPLRTYYFKPCDGRHLRISVIKYLSCDTFTSLEIYKILITQIYIFFYLICLLCLTCYL